MGYEMTFDRTTAAKGRNGWFILDNGDVLLGQDASWLELCSKRLGDAAPISVRFAHPADMHQLGTALFKAATQWGVMRDSSGGPQAAARSPSPCPQCGGKDLWIRVTQRAEQKIVLHGPRDGEYHYDVLHEDVQDTTYHAATCRACDYVWTLEQASPSQGDHDPMTHKEQAWQILEEALQQSTQPHQIPLDDHEALLATVVEQYIEDEGISLFVTYPGLYEVLSLVFAAEIQEERQKMEEEERIDSADNERQEDAYNG